MSVRKLGRVRHALAYSVHYIILCCAPCDDIGLVRCPVSCPFAASGGRPGRRTVTSFDNMQPTGGDREADPTPNSGHWTTELWQRTRCGGRHVSVGHLLCKSRRPTFGSTIILFRCCQQRAVATPAPVFCRLVCCRVHWHDMGSHRWGGSSERLAVYLRGLAVRIVHKLRRCQWLKYFHADWWAISGATVLL